MKNGPLFPIIIQIAPNTLKNKTIYIYTFNSYIVRIINIDFRASVPVLTSHISVSFLKRRKKKKKNGDNVKKERNFY